MKIGSMNRETPIHIPRFKKREIENRFEIQRKKNEEERKFALRKLLFDFLNEA